MTQIVSHEPIAGFEAPVHRALTEPILLAGAPRTVAILNGTVPVPSDRGPARRQSHPADRR